MASQTIDPYTPESLPEQFLVDLVIGTQSFGEVCNDYGLDEDEIAALESDLTFQKRLRRIQREVEDDGSLIEARARHWLSDTGLRTLNRLATDQEVGASVQHDAVKTFIKLAGMEKKEQTDQGGGNGATIIIEHPTGAVQINSGGQDTEPSPAPAAQARDVTPAEDEVVTRTPPASARLFKAD